MIWFLLLVYEVELSKIKFPPKIDGKIESIWREADSITKFTQCFPRANTPSSESTTAWILQDEDALYVAFRCQTKNRNPFINLTGPEDQVILYLDTFNDKTTAYCFIVNVSGRKMEGRILQDGREKDFSWQGVWFYSVNGYYGGYDVEMKIPFKSLQYKKGLAEWGVNFSRWIYKTRETAFWSPISQNEGLRVSRFGKLKGITIDKPSLYTEIYPIALARYELNSVYPKAGLDLNWKFTHSYFSLTAYPDFAQIEADPYRINLSKYEIHFKETRPFFIEGQEIFDTPIKLFYSRRIGKRIRAEKEVKEIPIITSAKYIGLINRINFGVIEAYTDAIETEPKALYSVGRCKIRLFENSEVGLLYSEVRSKNVKQEVLGIDATFRSRQLQVTSEVAQADSGNGNFVEIVWDAPKFKVIGKHGNYDEKFDINRIGFLPWKGVTKHHLSAGPQIFNIGPFYRLGSTVGISYHKEVLEPTWGCEYNFGLSCLFKNNCSSNLSLYRGKDYEKDKEYKYYKIMGSTYTDYAERIAFSGTAIYTSYGFNYRRKYFAPTGKGYFSFKAQLFSSIAISLILSNTIEWKPDGELEAISWVFRPILQYTISKDMHIRIYTEPNTDTHIHQFNALLSYNFRAKSWFYLALNEARDNTEGKMAPSDRIAVVKVRYLFFL